MGTDDSRRTRCGCSSIRRARSAPAVNEDYESGNEHEVELDDQARDTHAMSLAEEEADDLTAEETPRADRRPQRR